MTLGLTPRRRMVLATLDQLDLHGIVLVGRPEGLRQQRDGLLAGAVRHLGRTGVTHLTLDHIDEAERRRDEVVLARALPAPG